jgi:PAS domain S-box-containing protein
MYFPAHNTPESLCRWFIENADFGIIITDSNLLITDVNRWLEKNTEKKRSDLIGNSVIDLFPEIKQRGLDRYLLNALNGASVILSARFHSHFIQVPIEYGTWMKQNVRISAITTHSAITGLVIQIEDVTERIVREELLQRRNEELVKQNATKDKFFKIISHDLRSPFTALLGFTEILKNDNSLSQEQMKNIIDMLHTAVKNQYDFLENLLKWAQLQTGKFKLQFSHFSFKEIISHLIEIALPISESKNIQIVTNVPDDLVMYSDSNALTTIIYNLLFNALKFTKSGSNINPLSSNH